MSKWIKFYTDRPEDWPNEGQDVIVRMLPPLLSISDVPVYEEWDAKFCCTGIYTAGALVQGFTTNQGILTGAARKYRDNGYIEWKKR